MRTVQYMVHTLPILREAIPVSFSDGDYKLWKVVCENPGMPERFPQGAYVIMREMVGKISLQQRLDDFLRTEQSTPQAFMMLFSHHVEPATEGDLEYWADGHFNQKQGLL